MTTSTLEKPESTTDLLRIGIIGAGSRGIGCFGHYFKSRDDAQVVALADPNPVRMEGAADVLNKDLKCYTDLEEMCRVEKLDGVVITTPDYLHAEHVIAALRAGVPHVMVDKPLAITAAGCMEVVRAMEETGGHVAIGFNLRHLPLIAKIKEIIDSGEIGDLMLIENREFYDGGRTYMARWNRKYEWSGGLWIHKGSHDFDVFNWWNSKGTPIRVSAAAGLNALRPDKLPFEVQEDKPVGPNCSACAYRDECPDAMPIESEMWNQDAAQVDGYLKDLCIFLSDKDVHDNGIALVEYDNNVRASHLECFVCNFTDRLYTIVGDKGTLVASADDPRQIEVRPRWGENYMIDVPLPEDGGHGGADPLLVENFINGIKNGTPHSATVRDGIRAVAVGDAAERSWRTHRMVDIAELVDLNDPVLQDH